MNTFQRAGEDVFDLTRELVSRYHYELNKVEAKIDIVFAFRDPESEAEQAASLMERGLRVLGQARVNSLKHRVLGLGDCEILLDGDAWANMRNEDKMALLDHQLSHFEVKRDKKTGACLFDDYNRPVIKIRPHDREAGFFDAVALRHGDASGEVRAIQMMLLEADDSYGRHLQRGRIELSRSDNEGKRNVEPEADQEPNSDTRGLKNLKSLSDKISNQ